MKLAFYEDWDIFQKIENLINNKNTYLLAHGDPGKTEFDYSEFRNR